MPIVPALGAPSTGPTFTLATESDQDDLTQIHVTAPTVSASSGTLLYSWTGMHSGATTFSTTGLGDTTTSTPTVTLTKGGPVALRCAITDDNGTVTVEKVVCHIGIQRLGYWFVEVFRLSRYTGSSIDLQAAGTGTQSLAGAGNAGGSIDVEITGAVASATACTLSGSGFSLTASGTGGNVEVPYTNAYSAWAGEPIWFEVIAAGDYSTSGNQVKVYHADSDGSDREGVQRRNTSGTVRVDGVKRVTAGTEANDALVSPQNSTCVLGALLLSDGETRKYSDTGTAFSDTATQVAVSGRSRDDSGSAYNWDPEKVVVNLSDAGGDTLTVPDMRMLVAL